VRLCVIGAGYVGLVQAAGMASLGHTVSVGEQSTDRVRGLNNGIVPFDEPGLEDLVREGLEADRLSFSADNIEAVEGARVVFVAVPTPESADGSADLSIVENVIDEIAGRLDPGAILAFKSTVPVGTVDGMSDRLLSIGRQDVAVASNPEFLAESSAVDDFLHPGRIVIGTRSEPAGEVLASIYRDLRAPVVVTDPVSAEMIKYSSNAYLATRVTFANAIANVCEVVGADVEDVLLGMGYDDRIGHHFMRPGPGFGGSCFPKDTKALAAIARSAGYRFSLLEGVIEVNDAQHRRVVDKVDNAVGGLNGTTVALLGLAYKAGTADLRGSPAVELARLLTDAGAKVRAYDPAVRTPVDGVEQTASVLEAATGAAVILIATEWPEFSGLDLPALLATMSGDAIVDGRNMLEPDTARAAGFRYIGIGR
jgi:UDPglucose 6-dehydrogenase